MSRGASEDLVAKLGDYERSDLPERTKAALRLADRLTGAEPTVDETFYEALRRHFSDDQILDLGMTITFASGWQRFIEAFGIVPDRWRDGTAFPWGASTWPPKPPSARDAPAEPGRPSILPPNPSAP